MRPWRRLASLRASRRRHGELPPPPPNAEAVPMPPLEAPDDDREFLPRDRMLALPFVPIPRPGSA